MASRVFEKFPVKIIKEVRCYYEWIMSMQDLENGISYSPMFYSHAEGVRKLQWQLGLGQFPRNKPAKEMHRLLLCLLTLNDEMGNKPIDLKCSFTVQDYDTGEEIFSDDKPVVYEFKGPSNKIGYSYPFRKSQDDQIKESSSPGINPESDNQVFKELSQDFGTILTAPKCADFTICVKNREFKVHKEILLARSPVFASAMLITPSNQGNRVEIHDLDPEIVQEMLNFIYTGSCPNLTKMAEQLFIVADRYELKSLKKMAKDELISFVSAAGKHLARRRRRRLKKSS